MTKTMKAIMQDQNGPPDVLELRDTERPEIGDADVDRGCFAAKRNGIISAIPQKKSCHGSILILVEVRDVLRLAPMQGFYQQDVVTSRLMSDPDGIAPPQLQIDIR